MEKYAGILTLFCVYGDASVLLQSLRTVKSTKAKFLYPTVPKPYTLLIAYSDL